MYDLIFLFLLFYFLYNFRKYMIQFFRKKYLFNYKPMEDFVLPPIKNEVEKKRIESIAFDRMIDDVFDYVLNELHEKESDKSSLKLSKTEILETINKARMVLSKEVIDEKAKKLLDTNYLMVKLTSRIRSFDYKIASKLNMDVEINLDKVLDEVKEVEDFEASRLKMSEEDYNDAAFLSLNTEEIEKHTRVSSKEREAMTPSGSFIGNMILAFCKCRKPTVKEEKINYFKVNDYTDYGQIRIIFKYGASSVYYMYDGSVFIDVLMDERMKIVEPFNILSKDKKRAELSLYYGVKESIKAYDENVRKIFCGSRDLTKEEIKSHEVKYHQDTKYGKVRMIFKNRNEYVYYMYDGKILNSLDPNDMH